MAFSRNQQAVAELYIAALGRSPEMGGLDYWVSQLESGKKSLMEIQSSFFDINLPEVAARFPIGTTSREYVESIYLNVFERASDEGGLAYWANRLDLPQTDANHLSTATLMSTMLDIAKDPANFIDGAVLSANLATAESIYQNQVFTDSLILLKNGFTEEWLNGKTLYGAFDWGIDGWTFSETTFLNGLVDFHQTIDGNFTENYILTNDGKIHVTNNEDSFFWSVEEITKDYIRVTPQAGEQDYFYFESEKAHNLVKNNGIIEAVDLLFF